MWYNYRKLIIAIFLLWGILSAFFVSDIKFSFDFEQFFPQGDEDLEFFRDFIEEFETDDNFLLIAVEHQPTVFDSSFLKNFHHYCLELRNLPYVQNVQSLTMMRYPIKTPFGVSTIPAIHRDEPAKYDQDKHLIMTDQRFVYNLINEDANALVAYIKTKDTIDLHQSRTLMDAVHQLNESVEFEALHMLGRADLQVELVDMQQKEIIKTSTLSGILVAIILFLIFRTPLSVFISLFSIGLGLLIFVGCMGIIGREFNALSALYPVLLLIVGTSDVIHIKSKYIDELRKGQSRKDAMSVAIKEIGLATLLTSVTTSIGFATLITSRVQPVREFGINSAIGVMLAYITIIFFTTSLLTYIPTHRISRDLSTITYWDRMVEKAYQFSKSSPMKIVISSIFLLFVFLWGISLISTNYTISGNMPRGARVTEDFLYFEKEFAGFRPFEYAIFAKNDLPADGYEVLKEVDKIERHLSEMESIKATTSLATFYKGIERMKRGNQLSGYQFPENKRDFMDSKRMLERSRMTDPGVLVNQEKTKTRISSRIADIGADSIKVISKNLDDWITANIDSTIIETRRTGTGVILDKNAIYIRDNLLQGLVLAILAVSILMGLLFKKIRMLGIALIPNLFPLLLAGAIIGFAGIELEAGVSVVFAIIFGIAVDDTIHFLSKFNLARRSGKTVEDSLHITFRETGKAIVFTTIILFFGFLIMLFSTHPPSITIGLLIAATLVGALVCDLTLLPVLMRRFL